MKMFANRLDIMEKRNNGRDGAPGRPPPTPLAIRLNNFVLWGASGCVLPYLSIYFSHYTTATSSHMGLTMLLSSMSVMILNLTLSSIADRYRAHRLVYLGIQISAFLTYSVLLIPIFTSSAREKSIQPNEFETNDAIGGKNLINESNSAPSEEEMTENNVGSINTTQTDAWFYIVAFCLATGAMLTETMSNFSESFSANIAERCQQSYGSVKFWGALGWCASSLGLYFLSNMTNLRLPYLGVEFGLFPVLTLVNILIVLFWPDKRPFDLSSSPTEHKPSSESGAPEKGWPEEHVGQQQVAVRLKHLTQWLKFDSQDDETNRNVRRCSLAPIGDSGFLVKQYELTPRPVDKQPENGLKFKYVTCIEAPNHQSAQNGTKRESNIEFGLTDSSVNEKEVDSGTVEVISFKDYTQTLMLVVKNDKTILRFLLLYTVVGFNVAQNWYYLYPYLKHLDEKQFHGLAAFVQISGYLSETLFYSISSYVTKQCAHSIGLGVILLLFALRYGLYLAMDYFPETFPMGSIVLIELLQAPTMGWFNCIFSEAPLEFSRNFKRKLEENENQDKPSPKESRILESGNRIESEDNPSRLHKVDMNLTLLGVSSCCFDGIGVAFGSLFGGWLIDSCGFRFLWFFIICLSLAVCCLNLLFEFYLSSAGKSSKQDVQKTTNT